MIVAKYKFNPNTYADLLPIFNNGYTSYTKSDITNDDGSITRTINSDSLPTVMKFVDSSATSSSSLLEILDMNTSNLTTMDNMFRYCDNLTNISCDWDTSKVTSMLNMFNGCSSLTSLNVSNWDVSQVTNMSGMFQNCTSLTSLDVSKWDTNKVTNMSNMFQGCNSLISLDLINWDTSKVTSMSYIFNGCKALTSLDVSNWNTSKVTNMGAMFNGCNSLISLDLINWNTSKVTSMSSMFYGCNSLISLDLINWNTSKVTDMGNMFNGCKALTSLDVSKWDTSRLTRMGAMFFNCVSLITLNLSNWNTINLVNMSNIFYNCSSLTSLDISNWNTSQVLYIVNPFYDCRNLRKVNLKYANESTVSKIHENLPDRSSTTKGYILSLVDLTSDKNWELLKFTHNEVYLPQPLRKIENVKDRLYWDYDKGHYCIENNITHRTLSPSSSDFYQIELSDDSSYIKAMLNINAFAPNHNTSGNLVFIPPLSNTLIGSNYYDYGDVNGNAIALHTNILLKFETKYLVSNDSEGLAQWFTDNPTYIEYISNPQIIDLIEMNKKITFDTYLPNTSVKVTNLPIQPYSLLLEDDTVRYKATIEPSTLYTIQFNCLAKSITNLTLDLGGTRVTVEPIIGVNHVQITTPSELTSDRLFLIGTGIIINEVIVNKGNMNQYTKYFDGEQSVGELQEDGSYIIRVSTDNYTNLWEGDL